MGAEYRAALQRGELDPLLHPNPARPPRIYRLVVWLAAHLLPRLFRVRVVGLDNLPPPPYLIAANHQAWYDALFILAVLPSRPMVYTMGRRDTVFNRALKRWLMRRLGVFPISPNAGELDQRGLDTVYQLLDRGAPVLIFPEGRYSSGRSLKPLRRGVAHFSLQAGLPIVPVALSGLERLRPRAAVEISIGPPIWPEAPRSRTLNARVARLLERVQTSIMAAFGGRGREGNTGGALGGVIGRLIGRRRP